MKTCPNCQNENPDQAKFCKSCGYSFDGKANPAATSPAVSTPGSTKVLIVLLILVVLLGGFILYRSFFQKSTGQDGKMAGTTSDNASGENEESSSSFPYEEFTVAVKGVLPPYLIEGENGDYTGIEIALLDAAAEKENFSWEYEYYPGLEACLDALEAGEVDGVMATVPISDEYDSNIEFSEPYIVSGIACIVPDSSTIENLDELKGQKVAVLKNETGQGIFDYISSLQSQYGFEVVPFETMDQVYDSVKSGECAALFDDYNDFRMRNKSASGFKKIGDLLQRCEYGLAVNKDKPKGEDLLDRFNVFLKASDITGELGAILQQFIQYTPWEDA